MHGASYGERAWRLLSAPLCPDVQRSPTWNPLEPSPYGLSMRPHHAGRSDSIRGPTGRTFPSSGSAVGTLRRKGTSGASPNPRVALPEITPQILGLLELPWPTWGSCGETDA